MRPRARLKPWVQRGFTMVELVVAISISSVVVAFMVMFLTAPMDTYLAQDRRSELTYSADSVLHMLGSDVRKALPYSLRTQRNGSMVIIEMLNVTDSARYRIVGIPASPARELDFTVADTQFDTLGKFRTLPANAPYLSVLNNLGSAAADVYALTNVITPTGTNIQIVASATPGEDHVTLTPAFKFAADSPAHRAFLVSGPVAYLCDEIAHTLVRYDRYSIDANLSNHDSAAKLLALGANSSMVASNINSCAATITAGLPQQNDLLGVYIQFASSGDQLRIFKQFAVETLP